MADQVKTSFSSQETRQENLLLDFSRVKDVVLKHKDAWNRFVAGFIGEIALAAYPIGTIYTTEDSAFDPNVTFGGTWVAYGAGRVLVGLDSGDTDFDTAGETGGAKTVTLTTAEMPSHTHLQDAHTHTQEAHNHTQDAHSHTMSGGQTDDTTVPLDRPDAATSGSPSTLTTPTNSTVATNQAATATNQNTTATNQNTGGGGAHANVQPYIVVCRWKRTA